MDGTSTLSSSNDEELYADSLQGPNKVSGWPDGMVDDDDTDGEIRESLSIDVGAPKDEDATLVVSIGKKGVIGGADRNRLEGSRNI